MSKSFKVHIPVELIKGKDGSGKKTMKMRGVASTPSLDADGEYLDPKGFQSEYFLKHGFMNWNHQTNQDPSAIVGRPTEAKVKGNEYLIGFDLFPESKKAQQIYALQEVLQTSGLALGLSIEGKVLERDPNNKSKVTKARITGCAITPNPKNQDTVAEIIKGNSYNELEDKDEDEENKDKSLSAGSSSGQAIAKESLDGDLKTIEMSKKIKKSEVIEIISRDLPSLNNKAVEAVYNLSLKIQKSIDMKSENDNKQEITPETLEKAYQILDLANPTAKEAGDDLTKGEPTKAVADMTPGELLDHEANLQKSLQEVIDLKKGEGADATVVDAAKAAEANLEKGDDMKKMEGEDDAAYKARIAKMKKPDMKKGESNDELVKAIGDMLKGQLAESQTANDEKFKAVGTIIKGFKDELGEVRTLLAENPGKKSVTTVKEQVIQKSFAQEGEGEGNDTNYVSIGQSKAAITKALTDDFLAKGGKDESLRKSIILLDSSGEANPQVIKAAKELGMTLIP